MNQFQSFILQYTSNAAERVACHYKERSLTLQIVASRVLSRAPPPPLQPTQSDLPLTAFAAWASEWQHLSKKCSVSLSSREPILWSQCNVQYRPSPKNIRRWGAILRLTRQMLWAAGRIESAGGEEGARLSTLLATIRNVNLRSL
jgi:hypothetical protein